MGQRPPIVDPCIYLGRGCEGRCWYGQGNTTDFIVLTVAAAPLGAAYVAAPLHSHVTQLASAHRDIPQ